MTTPTNEIPSDLAAELKLLRQHYDRLISSILPVACDIHARFSVGCSECRLVQMTARIDQLEEQNAALTLGLEIAVATIDSFNSK